MLKAKSGSEKPADYVDVQRQYNSLHSNGRNVFRERACVDMRDLCERIKMQGWHADSLLDVGCRMGYAMDVYLQHFPEGEAMGIDVVPEFVEQAQRVADAEAMDMHEMTFDDGEFDWVFCTQVVEHAYNPLQAMDELFRVAKQGVFVAVPVESEQSFEMNPSHLWRAESMCDWLREMMKYSADGWDAFKIWYDAPTCSMYAIFTKEPFNG